MAGKTPRKFCGSSFSFENSECVTDSLPSGMKEAIICLKLAAAAGTDVCFIEGVKKKELLESTVKALAPTPVLVNVISGGLTPAFTYQQVEEMGDKIISKLQAFV